MVQTTEMLTFEEIKKMCPDEWVVLANPVSTASTSFLAFCSRMGKTSVK